MTQKKQHSLLSNALFNVLRVTSNLLITLFTFPYISRTLGPENLGKVNFATSVCNYFILFASLGIPSYGIIVCSKARDKKVEIQKTVLELLLLNIILAVVSYFCFVICYLCIGRLREDALVMMISSLTIVFSAFSVEWLYTAFEDFAYISIRTIFVKVVTVILFYLYINSRDDYFEYALILAASTIGTNLFNFFHARNRIKFYPLSELNICRHIKPILLFFMASVASTINANTDVTMLGFIKGNKAVGLYEFSVKIKNILTGIMTAGLSSMVPRLSALYAKGDVDKYKGLLARVFFLMIVLSFAMTSFICVFADCVIGVLGGNEYLYAINSMRILTACILPLAFTWILGIGILQPVGKTEKYSKTMIIACLVNITLNSALIPVFDTFGAAVATFLTESIVGILFYYYAKDYANDVIRNVKYLRICILSLSSVFISKWLCTWFGFDSLTSVFLGGLCSICVYMCLLYVFCKDIWNDIFAIFGSRSDKYRA